jgi:hypothetical protein
MLAFASENRIFFDVIMFRENEEDIRKNKHEITH